MSGTLVFVPVAPEAARQLAAGQVLSDVQAFSVTPSLLETFGLQRADDEDAERGCLLLASVWGLARHGVRLVLVGEVAPDRLRPEQNPEAHNGGALLGSLGISQVSAWFSDDPSNPLPREVSQIVAGKDVDDAWEMEPTQRLLAQADLLWHSVEELGAVGEDV